MVWGYFGLGLFQTRAKKFISTCHSSSSASQTQILGYHQFHFDPLPWRLALWFLWAWLWCFLERWNLRSKPSLFQENLVMKSNVDSKYMLHSLTIVALVHPLMLINVKLHFQRGVSWYPIPLSIGENWTAEDRIWIRGCPNISSVGKKPKIHDTN